MSIVMGLDQHRGQITGEWIDLETGEVQRTRVVPADRGAVRKFVERFRGQELEVALEATTGWRFVVEELRRIGAEVHLAEPAETAGLRKTERPQRFPQRDHPITHHVADPGANPRVVDRSKAGRPRAQDPSRQPRTRTTSQPQFNPDNPGPRV